VLITHRRLTGCDQGGLGDGLIGGGDHTSSRPTSVRTPTRFPISLVGTE
jgi:hypothetical protein